MKIVRRDPGLRHTLKGVEGLGDYVSPGKFISSRDRGKTE